MSDIIDLRSDTVTRPGPEMRRAMFEAEVGDDVFNEDPTIHALERKAAELLGREAAIFVPSGTMANQLAIKVQTQSGDEVLIEGGAHPFMYESAAASVISGIQFRTLPGTRGILDPASVEPVIRPEDPHFPPTRLVAVENTSNRGGGTVYPMDTLKAIHALARKHSLKIHMDGARLFNAVVASGVSAKDYAALADTVSFCLSKGLGAPVGSLLVADADVIHQARRWRKALGGGMRQAGILAAAGLFALENHIERLADDHANARFLAEGLNDIPGLAVNPDEIDTNIVIFQVTTMAPVELTERLKAAGVLMLPFGPDQIRAVTHLDVDRGGIERALEVIRREMGA